MRHANIRALLWLQVSPQWDTLNKAQLIFCTVGYSPMPGCRDRQKFHFDPSAPAALIQRAIRAINSDDLPRSAVLAAQKITRLSLHSTAKTVSPLFGQGPVYWRLWVACTGREAQVRIAVKATVVSYMYLPWVSRPMRPQAWQSRSLVDSTDAVLMLGCARRW